MTNHSDVQCMCFACCARFCMAPSALDVTTLQADPIFHNPTNAEQDGKLWCDELAQGVWRCVLWISSPLSFSLQGSWLTSSWTGSHFRIVATAEGFTAGQQVSLLSLVLFCNDDFRRRIHSANTAFVSMHMHAIHHALPCVQYWRYSLTLQHVMS